MSIELKGDALIVLFGS